MTIKKIIIGFVALVLIIAGVIFIIQRNSKEKLNKNIPLQTPSVESKLEAKFNGLKIPDDTEKIELKNVSSVGGMGIATKNEIFADLPELGKNEAYKVLLGNGTKTIFLGILKESKGGWILEYDLSKYTGFNKIIIANGTKNILEGSF